MHDFECAPLTLEIVCDDWNSRSHYRYIETEEEDSEVETDCGVEVSYIYFLGRAGCKYHHSRMMR